MMIMYYFETPAMFFNKIIARKILSKTEILQLDKLSRCTDYSMCKHQEPINFLYRKENHVLLVAKSSYEKISKSFLTIHILCENMTNFDIK